MIILEDSNEQKPLTFNNPMITEVSREKIWVPGTRFSLDYGVRFKDGHVPKVFFERKSLSDLFGTMGTGYKRFKRKMIACQDSGVQMMVIIEGTLLRVQTWQSPVADYTPQVFTGEAMIKKLFTLWVKHGLLSIYCKSRQEMSEYITSFYIALGKEYLRKQGKRRLK